MEKSSAHEKGISLTTSKTPKMEQWQTKFAVGDVSILKGESNLNKWTMGVVVGAISDNDGIIPSARIRISKLTGALSQN